MPKVTILMPVYNGEKYLREAMDSVLAQTYTDFEFLIINDASTDGTLDIIRSYSDPRIRLINNEINLERSESSNIGLKAARGEFIARADCDDINLPERIAKQTAFMEAHPEIGVCGTWVKTIGRPESTVWDFPSDDPTIRSRLLFESVIAHPSAMIRKDVFLKADLLYNPEYIFAEDYDLWTRASEHTFFANIPYVLVLYRIKPPEFGTLHREEKNESAASARKVQLSRLGIIPTESEIGLHGSISTWTFEPTRNFVNETEKWLIKLANANRRVLKFPEPAFSHVLESRWFALCNAATPLGLWAWRKYLNSPLRKEERGPLSQRVLFFLKCLLRRGSLSAA